MFALVINGRPLDTNFQAVDTKKMITTIVQPSTVTEFTIALLQPTIPQDHSVAVYYSIPPNDEWEYIGKRPSFRQFF